eukprot:193441-Pelagomonas_calceolata.AAC.1
MQGFIYIKDLRYRQQKAWRKANALSPQEVNKKAVTYHCLRGVWNADALAEHGAHTNKLAKYHHWMALPLRP